MILQGKNAIITGTSRGIGKNIVEVFAKEGANIWACSRKKTIDNDNHLKSISDKYGVVVNPLYFDMMNAAEMKDAIKSISKDNKNIDILVNNAGVTFNSLFQMTTIDQWRSNFEINLFSVVNMIQYVYKIMLRNKKGSIVNIASTAGIDGNEGRSVYGCTKASIICLTKTISKEFSSNGIRVNAIAPGIIQTDMLNSMKENIIQEVIIKSCMKRIGCPCEISNVAAFLASDMSSYITGQVIRVDGGL